MVMHDYHLSFVEHTDIRIVFSHLRENTPTITRNTAGTYLIRIYAREKLRMKLMLAEAPGPIIST